MKMYEITVFFKKSELNVLEETMEDFEKHSKDFDELMERAKNAQLNADLLEVMWKIIEKKRLPMKWQIYRKGLTLLHILLLKAKKNQNTQLLK